MGKSVMTTKREKNNNSKKTKNNTPTADDELSILYSFLELSVPLDGALGSSDYKHIQFWLGNPLDTQTTNRLEAKAVPLHAMKALGWKGIAPTHSIPRH
jgi:hypothetical protein